MSVVDIDVIDMVGTTSDGIVTLTVSDHLAWEDEGGHLLTLQNKINTYIYFIESGNIYKEIPLGNGKPLAIKIYFKYEPTGHMTISFLEKVSVILKGLGVILQVEQMFD